MKAILYPVGGGAIVQRAQGTPEMIEQIAGHLGTAVLQSEDETAVAVTAQGALVQPVATLRQMQDARWTDALAVRDARQESGCDTPLGRVDTDPDSQRKISGAATAAIAAMAVGQPFPPIG